MKIRFLSVAVVVAMTCWMSVVQDTQAQDVLPKNKKCCMPATESPPPGCATPCLFTITCNGNGESVWSSGACDPVNNWIFCTEGPETVTIRWWDCSSEICSWFPLKRRCVWVQGDPTGSTTVTTCSGSPC